MHTTSQPFLTIPGILFLEGLTECKVTLKMAHSLASHSETFDKLIADHPVDKFTSFYGFRTSTTAFTGTRHVRIRVHGFAAW